MLPRPRAQGNNYGLVEGSENLKDNGERFEKKNLRYKIGYARRAIQYQPRRRGNVVDVKNEIQDMGEVQNRSYRPKP